ncbi:endonuclease/exonuclease/phosphatase family protein [Gayadomonas joobiniege]|uniref:endonuclease/exonuclease/phosphatase family protein n=1 Tax=Gayadomonas joobiniege TaxID=1234606 RepID=UPI0003603CEC|nr:endonuclease/exonuclease/phosphatase family protein [Gayadomonas joobiniege]
MFKAKVLAGCLAMALSSFAQSDVLFQEDFSIGLNGQFTPISVASDKNWFNDTYNNTSSAAMNGYGQDVDSNDWLISPQLDLNGFDSATFSFKSRVRFDGQNIRVKVSTDYVPGQSPENATWTMLNPSLPQDGQGSSGSDFETSGDLDLSAYLGEKVYLAFHYTLDANGNGDVAGWYIDDVVVEVSGNDNALPLTAAMTASKQKLQLAQPAQFKAMAYNGAGDYEYMWDFGNGRTATGAEVEYAYDSGGSFTVSLTVKDKDGTEKVLQTQVTVEEPNIYLVKDKKDNMHLRVATFNASMEAENYDADNAATKGTQILIDELASGDNEQIKNIAEIIQRVRPDVVLINEFDYIPDENSGVEMFISQYLNVPQADGAQSINYDYYFVAPSNTGIATNYDLNNDGIFDGVRNDAFGFGQFEGHYGMVLLSRYPIVEEEVRTFQKFLWKDMPGHLMPIDPDTGDDWFDADETNIVRLSSKSHWDVPVNFNGEIVHILASHPTPPVFDGEEDLNGRRNHDETRLWADYIDPEMSAYIYDDEGNTGGLSDNARFVIVGDLNASTEGDAYPGTIEQLLNHEKVDTLFTPSSDGGLHNDITNPLAPYHTANWKMRADYVLPSKSGLAIEQGDVFWPTQDQDLYPLVESRSASSDHFLVWLDLSVEATAGEDEEETDDSEEIDNVTIESGSMNWLFIFAGLLFAAIRRKA